MHTKCLNCGSTHIIEASKIIDYDTPFNFSVVVRVFRNPRAFMFKGGPELNPAFVGDMDGNCSVDIADLTYLVAYMFKNGPGPGVGR